MAGKRYQTAICAIAKDENPYFLEWAAYHLALGFEHIFVYDNMSRESLAELLSIPGSHRFVTVTRWPNIPGRSPQFDAYEHFLWTRGQEVEWTAVIDLDELIHLKRHDHIHDFLRPFTDATGVAINWRFFGSAGETKHRPGLLMERFTRASEIDFHPNCTVKAIYRTARVARLSHHISAYHGEPRVRSPDGSPVGNGPQIAVTEANAAIAQVNHYFVKSREEWQRKMARGYGWQTVDKSGMRDQYDRNECEDISILHRKAETERWMRIIGRSPAQAMRARVSRSPLGEAWHWMRRLSRRA